MSKISNEGIQKGLVLSSHARFKAYGPQLQFIIKLAQKYGISDYAG